MRDPDRESIEVPESDRETAARIQQAARAAAYLLAAAQSWLTYTLAGFEPGEPATVDGEPASDGSATLDLVSWTVERIQTAPDGPLAEAVTVLLAEAEAEQAEALARYVREEYRAYRE